MTRWPSRSDTNNTTTLLAKSVRAIHCGHNPEYLPRYAPESPYLIFFQDYTDLRTGMAPVAWLVPPSPLSCSQTVGPRLYTPALDIIPTSQIFRVGANSYSWNGTRQQFLASSLLQSPTNAARQSGESDLRFVGIFSWLGHRRTEIHFRIISFYKPICIHIFLVS